MSVDLCIVCCGCQIKLKNENVGNCCDLVYLFVMCDHITFVLTNGNRIFPISMIEASETLSSMDLSSGICDTTKFGHFTVDEFDQAVHHLRAIITAREVLRILVKRYRDNVIDTSSVLKPTELRPWTECITHVVTQAGRLGRPVDAPSWWQISPNHVLNWLSPVDFQMVSAMRFDMLDPTNPYCINIEEYFARQLLNYYESKGQITQMQQIVTSWQFSAYTTVPECVSRPALWKCIPKVYEKTTQIPFYYAIQTLGVMDTLCDQMKRGVFKPFHIIVDVLVKAHKTGKYEISTWSKWLHEWQSYVDDVYTVTRDETIIDLYHDRIMTMGPRILNGDHFHMHHIHMAFPDQIGRWYWMKTDHFTNMKALHPKDRRQAAMYVLYWILAHNILETRPEVVSEAEFDQFMREMKYELFEDLTSFLRDVPPNTPTMTKFLEKLHLPKSWADVDENEYFTYGVCCNMILHQLDVSPEVLNKYKAIVWRHFPQVPHWDSWQIYAMLENVAVDVEMIPPVVLLKLRQMIFSPTEDASCIFDRDELESFISHVWEGYSILDEYTPERIFSSPLYNVVIGENVGNADIRKAVIDHVTEWARVFEDDHGSTLTDEDEVAHRVADDETDDVHQRPSLNEHDA